MAMRRMPVHALACAAVLAAAGCSQTGVNTQPLVKLLRSRLEPQAVTPGTSLATMCRLYQASPGLVKRLNAGNPVLGRGDTIGRGGLLLMPRVSIDVILDYRAGHLRVSCGTILLRVYPYRLGPKAKALMPVSFFVKSKMRRKSDTDDFPHLGTRAIALTGGLVIHGGAPEIDPTASRYREKAAEGADSCIQLSNRNVEELYDLLERDATIMVVAD